MPDLDVIVSRKSIRRYKPDPVPDEMLDKVLEAARWAPTGENYQPWRFIVVRDQATRNRIADLARLGGGSRMTAWYCMGHMQERFAASRTRRSAPRCCASCTGRGVGFRQGCAGGDRGDRHADGRLGPTCPTTSPPRSKTCAWAHSLGLGACWVPVVASTRDAKKFKEILGIPTGLGQYKVIAYVSIGWPAEQRKHPRPKKPLEELVFWEKFGNKVRPRHG